MKIMRNVGQINLNFKIKTNMKTLNSLTSYSQLDKMWKQII